MNDSLLWYRVYIFFLLALIIILNIGYQSDLISAIKAVGIQCKIDYVIDIPDPEIENIKFK